MSPPPRRRRPRRKAKPRRRVPEHSSVPTGRAAYADTRAWLLAEHGPVCAYCGHTYTPRSLTLDHVAPRKGQSAYDRRDNLVLACKRCNTAKADKPFLVFLLAQRTRAERLLRYGQHLSKGILDILRHMAPDVIVEPKANAQAQHAGHRPARRHKYGDSDDSPYRDDSPYKT